MRREINAIEIKKTIGKKVTKLRAGFERVIDKP